jgi:uncharacterized membrane protein YqaE (UPF0057 family)
MYFKINNKLIKINSYKKLQELITSISKPYTYILINDKHYKQFSSERFNSLSQINDITVNYKLDGGFIDVIIETLIAVYKFIILIPKILIWLIQFIIWLFRFSIYLITAVLNLLQGGFIDIVKSLVKMIVYEPINIIFRLIKRLLGDGIQQDKTSDPAYRCYGPKDDGTIPTTILISTILCPPLGVFMMFGIKGWLYILISALLSLAFYIPGLIYALVLFYT